jgi:hypothetical protein
MGCWLSFRGSLTIDPPITEQDKAEYARKKMEELHAEHQEHFVTPKISEPDPEQYGGLFSK